MFTIRGELYSEIKKTKSKFLGFSFCLDSTDQAKERIEKLQQEYKDARHIVFAYRILENNIMKEKFFNDKEPVNSAGKPLLYLLQKKDIVNCLIVVVRYFGGVKLGVGGLIRAYTQAGQKTLEDNLVDYQK